MNKEYKLIIHPAVDVAPNKYKEFLFETYNEALAANDACASILIFVQDDIGVMGDYANMFIICKLINNEWIEVDDLDDMED